MKRRKRSKADIITGALYCLFVLLVAGVLYGLGSLGYALLGTTIGNSYYAALAEDSRADGEVDFAALSAENPEVKAWVRLDGTAVDLPIVQTTDNSFYLSHRFDEKRNKLGTPFIDAGNAGDFSDRHTVIYGHAVKSGALFGSFWEYENPNYYNRHPQLTLSMPNGERYTLAVFSCARVEGTRSAIPISFPGETAFLTFLDELHELSEFDSTVSVGVQDRIVSFCVCLPDGGDERLLVSCKIIADGAGAVTDIFAEPIEETPADTATPNGG